LAFALAAAVAAGGCAGGQEENAKARVSGTSAASCGALRQQLDKLDSKGVPSRIDAARAGKKLSASQQEDVDLYNRLLGDYLGNRCHLL